MKKIVLLFLVLLSMFMPDIGGHINWYAKDQNNGLMPVWCFKQSMIIAVDADLWHTQLTRDSKVPYLTDIFPMYVFSLDDRKVELDSMMSIGDIILWTGYSGFFISLFYLLVLVLDDLWRFLVRLRR